MSTANARGTRVRNNRLGTAAVANADWGVFVGGSPDTEVTGSQIVGGFAWVGLAFAGSRVQGNTIADAQHGVTVEQGATGNLIGVPVGSSNTSLGNLVTNNALAGVLVEATGTTVRLNQLFGNPGGNLRLTSPTSPAAPGLSRVVVTRRPPGSSGRPPGPPAPATRWTSTASRPASRGRRPASSSPPAPSPPPPPGWPSSTSTCRSAWPSASS